MAIIESKRPHGFGKFLALSALTVACGAGCYAGAQATYDTNAAWQGRKRATIEARWGRPAHVMEQGDGRVLTWTRIHHRIRLPSGSAHVTTGPGFFEAAATFRPGEVWRTHTDVTVTVDSAGTIGEIRGRTLRYGPPNDVNMRWGAIVGLHIGMGRLDDTSTALPSGGAYIGGMLSPTVGLVGTFSLAAGIDDAGGAMAFAWGLAPQWWPTTRLSLRGGPAMVLAFDPGFDNAGLEAGFTGAASYALVRTGNFVLDLRVDITQGTSVTFGSVGIGVNLN